jgi:serine-type anaerobic sulfatase-maturating enzyme
LKPFSLLVKPASFACNLRCKYCFYLEKKEYFGSKHFMSIHILEKMISTFMALELPSYSIGWQGGEPTLMGLDFFKKVVEFQQKYGKNGANVSNGLQTNATLLDDEWCKHLSKYNFLVGISIDGPKEIHDLNRLTTAGRGSHDDVMKGMNALKRNNVEFNVLTLVNSANVKQPLMIYNYLKDMGVNYHQYIECVEFDKTGELNEFAVRPEEWGEFLCKIFDEWYKHDAYTISVRFFDSILTKMVENYANACPFDTDCRQYLVVENNGNIYPCDFYVLPEYKLGNIMENTWETMLNSPVYEAFGARKRNWNEKCETCNFLNLCNGCCPKNRPAHGADPTKLSVLCKGWEMFYEHTMSRFKTLANQIIKDREHAAEQERIQRAQTINMQKSQQAPQKIGRNSPCPCGSGKKFKKCCGK